MSRYSHDLSVNKSAEQIAEIAARCLTGEGFKLTEMNGEQVWKKGNGILTGPQIIALKPLEGGVRVEAWIKFALLPFVYVGEMGVTGFVGAIPKTFLKDRVNKLERMLTE